MDLNYKNSGIKTLRFASPVLFLCGLILAIAYIPDWFIENNRVGNIEINWSAIIKSIICVSVGLVTSAVGLVLASIAESLLYLEQLVDEDKDDDGSMRDEAFKKVSSINVK